MTAHSNTARPPMDAEHAEAVRKQVAAIRAYLIAQGFVAKETK